MPSTTLRHRDENWECAFYRLRHRVIKDLVAELVEATVGGIFLFGFGVSITQSSRRFCWNDCVFEFPKEHQRCSRKHTDFNAIEIMCLQQAKAAWVVINNTVAELVEATMCGIFVFALITQSSRRFVEMMPFLSSQRNIRDVL